MNIFVTCFLKREKEENYEHDSHAPGEHCEHDACRALDKFCVMENCKVVDLPDGNHEDYEELLL